MPNGGGQQPLNRAASTSAPHTTLHAGDPTRPGLPVALRLDGTRFGALSPPNCFTGQASWQGSKISVLLARLARQTASPARQAGRGRSKSRVPLRRTLGYRVRPPSGPESKIQNRSHPPRFIVAGKNRPARRRLRKRRVDTGLKHGENGYTFFLVNDNSFMSTINRGGSSLPTPSNRRGRPRRKPSARNCAIYERVRLEGKCLEEVAADYQVTKQRISDIVAHVESWLSRHDTHSLAQKMRARATARYDTLWSEAMTGFARIRERRQIKKERVRKAAAAGADAAETVSEVTVREQNGDPRFLNIGLRVVEREDRLWMPFEDVGRPSQVADAATRAGGQESSPQERGDLGRSPHAEARLPYDERFPHLPAGLGDLAQLACGWSRGGLTPVSILFEQRCAEAFRSLGFEVRELGQGCGRVADCLAVAAQERFAVIIDAKVRRRGYTLGTDDRQFCEYAVRHTRELTLTGIERVYFAVVGHGFRQDDLDKLAGFMAGTPVRSVVFIEAEALMRLVDESIAQRREFRLADFDRLLFGNKIIDG